MLGRPAQHSGSPRQVITEPTASHLSNQNPNGLPKPSPGHLVNMSARKYTTFSTPRDKANGGDLHKYLRCQNKRRKRYASGRNKRGIICDQVRIDKRASIVENRKRLGDLEGNTVIGRSHKGAIVTLVDRTSRYLFTKATSSKRAPEVTEAILEILGDHKVKTITDNNGKEFANHLEIAYATNSKSYFAYPYHSWERGTNENTNGVLRQFFPKESDFVSMDPKDLRSATENLNHRPRKILGGKSPYGVHYGVRMLYTRSR